MAVDAAADVLGDLALEQLRRTGRELHDLHPTLDLAQGIRERLSVLGRDRSGEFGGAILENSQKRVENPGAPQRGRRRPIFRLCASFVAAATAWAATSARRFELSAIDPALLAGRGIEEQATSARRCPRQACRRCNA